MRRSNRTRTRIEDLAVAGSELSEEQLRTVSGGLPSVPPVGYGGMCIVSTACPASCTNGKGGPDTDYVND
jgi:hypothetical protein